VGFEPTTLAVRVHAVQQTWQPMRCCKY